MDLLLRLIHSGLPCKGGSSKSIRDIQKGPELASFMAKAGGAGVRAAFSGDRSAGRCLCSFVQHFSHPASLAQVGAKSELFINLANVVHLTLVIP